MLNAISRFIDDFLGHCKFPATASGVGAAWATAVTGTTPTVAGVTSDPNGAVKLALTSTSEAQIASLYWGDICGLKLDNIRRAVFRVKCGADITTAQTLTFGLTSARNDDSDATTTNAQFKLAASTAVVLETDDGTTDNDDKASGQTLSTSYKEFVIDFSNGLSDVRFFASNSSGKLVRLAAATTFDMSKATGTYVQPNIQLQKASGTTTPSVTVDYVEIESIRA